MSFSLHKNGGVDNDDVVEEEEDDNDNGGSRIRTLDQPNLVKLAFKSFSVVLPSLSEDDGDDDNSSLSSRKNASVKSTRAGALQQVQGRPLIMLVLWFALLD